MENKAKRRPALILAVIFIFICAIPFEVSASGSYYISTSSLSVTQGSSTTFTLGATNAVGAFTISTDGGVTASCSGETWLDNSSVTITVTGNTVGTGHVYISIYDGADYDGNDLSGKSYTVTVTVKSASGGTVSETTTVAATEAATTAASSSDDDDNDDDDNDDDDDEETAEVSETELLSVEAGGVSMTILKDVSGIDVPEGFEIAETVYNTVTVQTMVYEDIVLYVLEDEDGNAEYYTLSDSGEFEVLKYTLIDGVICIFLDMPDNLEIPNGYSLIETEIFGCTVEALIADQEESTEDGADESEEETSEDAGGTGEVSAAEYISFDTVAAGDGTAEDEDETGSAQSSVITIDDMVASSAGHYYVYCLYGGQKILFDYDSEEGTFGRCTALMILEAEDETEAETEAQSIAEETGDEEEDYTLILLAGLLLAAVIIIALAVVLIVVLARKRAARKKAEEDIDNIFFDEEDLFAGEYEASEEPHKEEHPGAMSFKEAAEIKEPEEEPEKEPEKEASAALKVSGSEPEEDDEDWAAEIKDEDFEGLVYELDLEDEVVLEELAEIEAEEDGEEEVEEEDELFAAILEETVIEQKKKEAEAADARESSAPEAAQAAENEKAAEETQEHKAAEEDAAGVGDILSEEFENIMDYINA